MSFSRKTTFEAGELNALFNEAILRKMVAEKRLAPKQRLSTYLPEIEEEITIEQYLQEPGKIPHIEGASAELIKSINQKSYQEEIRDLAVWLGLENTSTSKKIDQDEATGYLFYNYRGNGPELEVAPRDTLSTGIKTTPRDLLKIIQFLPEREINTKGYLPHGGFSYGLQSAAGLDIIILSNRRHPVASEMIKGVYAILEGKEYKLPLPRHEVKIDPVLLKDYAGSYAINSDMKLQVVTENDSLFVLMGTQKMHLKPQSPNQFFMEQRDSAIRFLRDSERKVYSAELLDGFLMGNKIRKVEE